jgi:hypothetical protein
MLTAKSLSKYAWERGCLAHTAALRFQIVLHRPYGHADGACCDPGWTGKHGTLANTTVEQDADADNNNDNNNNHDDHDSKPKAMDPCLIVLVQCLLAFDSEATPDFPKLIQNYRNKLGVNLDNYDFQSQGPTKDKIRRFICKLLNNA